MLAADAASGRRGSAALAATTMVPMPYILVNIVLDTFSSILFVTTSAALLSRYLLAKLGLPAQLRNRRFPMFVAQGLGLAGLSIVAVLITPSVRHVDISSLLLTDLFFFMGLINSVVLAYQFMDKRYFTNTPKLRRRLVIAILSVVVIFVSAIAVVSAVVGVFVIT